MLFCSPGPLLNKETFPPLLYIQPGVSGSVCARAKAFCPNIDSCVFAGEGVGKQSPVAQMVEIVDFGVLRCAFEKKKWRR